MKRWRCIHLRMAAKCSPAPPKKTHRRPGHGSGANGTAVALYRMRRAGCRFRGERGEAVGGSTSALRGPFSYPVCYPKVDLGFLVTPNQLKTLYTQGLRYK